MRGEYLRTDSVVSGMRVLEVAFRTPALINCTYHVVCATCGVPDLLTHRQLRAREDNGRTKCKVCAFGVPKDVADLRLVEAGRIGALLACRDAETLPAFPMTVPHVRGPDGHPWPSLGRMGPRWSRAA